MSGVSKDPARRPVGLSEQETVEMEYERLKKLDSCS